jgi:hypothetical protein
MDAWVKNAYHPICIISIVMLIYGTKKNPDLDTGLLKEYP